MKKHYSAEKLEKKMKFKAWLKKKKMWFIVYGAFLLVGVIAWIIGSYLSGANPIEWLTSSYAIKWYICVLVGSVIFVILMWIMYLRDKKNGGTKI